MIIILKILIFFATNSIFVRSQQIFNKLIKLLFEWKYKISKFFDRFINDIQKIHISQFYKNCFSLAKIKLK